MKLDVEFRRYVILGACNPNLAHRVLAAEPQIGLLLRCNVVVQEAPEGGVVVSIADPRAMFTWSITRPLHRLPQRPKSDSAASSTQ